MRRMWTSFASCLVLGALALPAAPISAQLGGDPVESFVPQLPGAGRPVDIEATRARRAALAANVADGLILIAAEESRDLERDVLQDNDFRQDDYFFYLTGLETPDAWLAMRVRGGRAEETTLFLPTRDPSQEIWTGLKLGPGNDAERLSGIAYVRSTDDLDAAIGPLASASGGANRIFATAPSPAAQMQLRAWAGGSQPSNLTPRLDALRLVKDAPELERMRRAIDITVVAQRSAMAAAVPGLFEYELEALIEYEFRRHGADRVGFPSIVGSGPNSTTLHYDVNRRQTRDGDLVVMDIGAEFGQYSADVTRTIPINGRFTPRQKDIYELVLGAQQAAIDATRPGMTLGRLTQIARSYIDENSGNLCGGSSCNRYFLHGLSHWLGMRVHDVGDYGTPLEVGMVFTIEPGIYIADEEIGVRIEDDILVTADGAEVLSAGAPRSVADIEALMAAGGR